MTGFILPTSTAAPIAQWSLQNWGAPARTGKAAAGAAPGVIRLDFEQLEADVQWLVDRAVVSCTSTSATSLRLYDSEPAPANLLSGSEAGNFDEAEYPSGLLVPELRTLVAVWTGCSDGAVASIRLQTRVMRRSR